MKKEISMGELIVAAVTLFTMGLTAYINVRVTDQEQNTRLEKLEGQRIEYNQTIRDINETMKDIQETQTQILIQMQNKQDRPK